MTATGAARPPICSSRAFFAASMPVPSTATPASSSRRAQTSPMRPMPMTPTGVALTIALFQGLDPEVARDDVEALAQRLRHRHAIGAALDELGVALLAGQPDALDAGKPPRVTDIADHRVDRALEMLDRYERLDRERANGVAGIGRLVEVLDEIDPLTAHCRAIERARQKPDDEAQPRTLVLADRQQ